MSHKCHNWYSTNITIDLINKLTPGKEVNFDVYKYSPLASTNCQIHHGKVVSKTTKSSKFTNAKEYDPKFKEISIILKSDSTNKEYKLSLIQIIDYSDNNIEKVFDLESYKEFIYLVKGGVFDTYVTNVSFGELNCNKES